jgi:hypothetical protein
MSNPTKSEIVDTLVREAEASGAQDDLFDDAVYDAAMADQMGSINLEAGEEAQEAEIQTGESRASDINNTGFAGQIEYLLSGYVSLEEGMRSIRAIIAEREQT